MTHFSDSLHEKLVSLYGSEPGTAAYHRLAATLKAFASQPPQSTTQSSGGVTERDVVLITYGDSLHEPGNAPLNTLHGFLKRTLSGIISSVHILPFFPYSSDDGFSVIDYQQVNPALGDWDDINRLSRDFKLMVDVVINHVSAQSDWFQRFLAGDPHYEHFFITVDPTTDLSKVVRPRTLPLLTPFTRPQGTVHVWTTFSADQIDLNFSHPDVLLRMIDVLLFYVRQGASLIRLDAIAYLWKTPGTTCIHLPQTHTVVKLFRDVLDRVAPHVLLITETNVPHAENMSYFGSGTDEAQMVYQFPLPPLLLHTIATGDATRLSDWAEGIQPISERATFFNFTASHDGIGVRPVEGILTRGEIEALVQRATAHGGAVSYKTNSDGSSSPYELNINYFDALSDPAADEPLEVQVQRFLVSQAIQIAVVGVPGIHIHSLLGSRNWRDGVQQTGHLRAINREKLLGSEVESALSTPGSLRQQVFDAYRRLILIRTGQKAFHPNGPQHV
ncbi:MAG: sugar phosphorylase, partial [Chloroflexi bacterium]